MLYTFLLIVLILLAILLCVIILLQSGKGGGLAATFGGASSSTDSFMGGRQAATLLTKLSWIGGGVFLFLAFVLALISSGSRQSTPSSILQGEFSGGAQQQVPRTPTSVLQAESAGARIPDTSSAGRKGLPLPGSRPDTGQEGAGAAGSGSKGSSGGTSR
jgi:preprotein translocase subunit SecG